MVVPVRIRKYFLYFFIRRPYYIGMNNAKTTPATIIVTPIPTLAFMSAANIVAIIRAAKR